MQKAFEIEAEFDGIFSSKSAEAFIDLVLQKCVIEVSENGLEIPPHNSPG